MNPYESPPRDEENEEKKYKPPETDWVSAIIIIMGLYGIVAFATFFWSFM